MASIFTLGCLTVRHSQLDIFTTCLYIHLFSQTMWWCTLLSVSKSSFIHCSKC